VYKGEPAERDVLGTKETVLGFTRESIITYRALQYTAPNTVVTVAGGVSEEAIVLWATQAFGSLSAAAPRSAFPTRDRKQAGPETIFIDKDTDQAHILMVWRTFSLWHPDWYVGRLLSSVLRSGMSSRLFVKLREELGSGYYIGAGNHTHDTFGAYHISTGTKSERVAEIISAILAETERLKSELVGVGELAKVKEYLRARRLMGLETSDDVADFYAHQEVIDKELKSPMDLEKIYAAITSADIMRVAQVMFQNDRLTVAVIGKGLDKDGIRNVL
jgi:predicted Zn-dependent peptidase